MDAGGAGSVDNGPPPEHDRKWDSLLQHPKKGLVKSSVFAGGYGRSAGVLEEGKSEDFKDVG